MPKHVKQNAPTVPFACLNGCCSLVDANDAADLRLKVLAVEGDLVAASLFLAHVKVDCGDIAWGAGHGKLLQLSATGKYYKGVI